jgi:hypothetical protein
MSNQLCDVEMLKIFLQLIFICIGWFVVHSFSSKRDLDKTKRDLFIKEAESLNDSVDEIFTLARQYHLDSSRDASKEADIKMKLQDLSHRLSLLNKTSLHSNLLDCASKSFVNFKRSITENNFEDEHHISLKEDSDQFQNIAGYAIDLKHMILNFKHSQLISF